MEWVEDNDESELQKITARYLPSAVVWTTDWTTGSLTEQLDRGLFNVDPPFQRRAVWNSKKASLYIESLLLGCPVPPITLAETEGTTTHHYVVIDGKQRLGTLKQFAVEKTLSLSGLEVLTNLNGLGFDEIVLKPEFSRFQNLPVRTNVVRNWQRDEVLHFIFHRLNNQVTPLSTHELRRSLIPGPFTEFLDQRSAESSPIQSILNITEPDYRLRDAELLLRALGYSLFLRKYKGNLKQFLDSTTKSLNSSWDGSAAAQVAATADGIDAAIDCTYQIFADDSFQRFEDGVPIGRFNRAVFDLMVTTLRHEDVRRAALANSDKVRSQLADLFAKNVKFGEWATATTKSREAVFGRTNLWADALGSATGVTKLGNRLLDQE